jgi:hypothetical protein
MISVCTIDYVFIGILAGFHQKEWLVLWYFQIPPKAEASGNGHLLPHEEVATDLNLAMSSYFASIKLPSQPQRWPMGTGVG